LIALVGLALLAFTMVAVVESLQMIFAIAETTDIIDMASFLAAGGTQLIQSVALLPLALGMLIGGGIGVYRRIVPN
jgi:hypothetical protein